MWAVAALNSLQKPMMFRPAWPRAGPTGGDGFACPALIVYAHPWQHTFEITFLGLPLKLPLTSLIRRTTSFPAMGDAPRVGRPEDEAKI